MKKWLLIAAGVVVVGCGLYFWWGLTGTPTLHERSLKFAEVRQTTIRDTISATGLVEPREIVLVSSKFPGIVTHLGGEIGASVSSGDVLAQLDMRDVNLKIEEAAAGDKAADAALLQARASLDQAEASKKAADQNLETQKRTATIGGFKTEKEYAEAQVQTALAGIKVANAGIKVAEAKKQAAQTAIKEAELARDLTRLVAPGSANDAKKRAFLILDRKVNEGQMVGPQSGPLFTLAGSLDVVEVHAQVVEGDVNQIRPGLSAYFKIKDYNNDDVEFQGKIHRIRPLSSSIKGAVYYDAVITVPNRLDEGSKEWQLRPGMTAPVDIVRREKKDVWQVPTAALNFKLDPAYLTDATKADIEKRKGKDWQPLWVWDEATRRPTPIFIRVVPHNDEIALKDGEGNEILEWETGKTPSGPLRVIIEAPPARPPGFFDQPANVKI
ncbi:MAG: efflux RND transporter periplasmic adaptor subunit [Planctomycetes bacterium]|nr:efflux RND transporter periplasmic adaptor subunit [Planctomycetota bacterium]